MMLWLEPGVKQFGNDPFAPVLEYLERAQTQNLWRDGEVDYGSKEFIPESPFLMV